MRIIYIGSAAGTSGQRAAALRRLGHEVQHVDPYAALPKSRVIRSWSFRSGAFGLARRVESYVTSQCQGKFDVLFVDNGELVSKRLVRRLQDVSRKSILYNLDNPFTPRDGRRWRLLKAALPSYDLFVTPRESSVTAAQQHGARETLRIWQSADELTHKPVSLSSAERRRYGSEVAFVGTWMPERGPFMKRLLDRGVPLRIFGPRWDRAAEFPLLRSCVTLGGLGDEEYVKAIAGTRIALVMLSEGNADLHTTRSVEIPSIGTLMCAPRTPDHCIMYDEDREAVFWEGADECADKCLALLEKPGLAAQIAQAGRERQKRNGNYNERALERVLDSVNGQGTGHVNL